ncbi:FAD-dependent oxidoreductase [Candidatus Latescibacterota bacterium]
MKPKCSRRQFIETSIPLAGLLSAYGCGDTYTKQNSGASRKPAELPSSVYDIVVIGGGISGCFAALHAAEKGLDVLLVERRSFLGREITATMRLWLRRTGISGFDSRLNELFFPEAEQSEIGIDESDFAEWFSDEKPLFNGSVKKQLMSALIDQGVHVMLMSDVCGILKTDTAENIQGVLIANKYGLHVARTRAVIDAGDSQEVSCGCIIGDVPLSDAAGYVLEFYNVSGEPERHIEVPAELGIVGHMLRVHKGKRLKKQYYVEFVFQPGRNPDVEGQARDHVKNVAAYLKDNHRAFAESRLKMMALETYRQESSRVLVSPPFENVSEIEPFGKLQLSGDDILNMKRTAEQTVDALNMTDNLLTENLVLYHANGDIPLDECSIYEPDDLKLWFHVKGIEFPYSAHLPASNSCDVLVAGGGTAGAMAAIAAVKEGVRVTVAEQFSEPGGTKTLGGVNGYYGCYKGLFYENYESETDAFGKRFVNNSKSIPVRMLYLRQEMTKKGGTFLSGTIICGAVTENNRVGGIVVSRNGMLSRIEGKIVIDATGDGDVAAYAGAKYISGGERVGETQNYSQWDVNPELLPWGDHDCNRDYDTIDNTRLSEMMRGLYLSHHKAHYYDFMPLLSVRESRQIVGKHVITITDVLNNRHYNDTIAVSVSDFDPHSFGNTEYSRAGYLLAHRVERQVEIPYRSIVPETLDGLLLSAKAISQTQNAMQFTRMSLDIMQLGYATGLIAAELARSGMSPREYDAADVQERLTSLGLLPSGLEHNKSDYDELISLNVDKMLKNDLDASFKLMSLPCEKVSNQLTLKWNRYLGMNQKILFAEARAWCRDDSGTELLAKALDDIFKYEKQTAGIPPMEVYEQDSLFWRINRTIALLGLAGDTSALDVLIRVAKQTSSGGPAPARKNVYYTNRIDLVIVPNFNRILNLCFAFERLADRKCVPALENFLQDEHLAGYTTSDYRKAGENFFGGYLELRIGAALARCGGKRGYEILIEYLGDIHHLFVSFAVKELEAITGESYGQDEQKWKNHIRALREPFTLRPYQKDTYEL